MRFSVVTIFPAMFSAFFSCGVLGRGIDNGLLEAGTVDIRDFAHDRHRSVDDRPFGGGSGMVMMPGPLTEAIETAKKGIPGAPVLLLGPRGRVFDQAMARELAGLDGVILVCGRYEGLDERVAETLADGEISVGDYVLSGGEPAAMVVIDAVARLVPGVLGNEQSPEAESFEDGLLEHAHFTRPQVFNERDVPPVLMSGHHAAIATWREETALLNTVARRPDLFEDTPLSPHQAELLKLWRRRIDGILRPRPVPGGPPFSGDQ